METLKDMDIEGKGPEDYIDLSVLLGAGWERSPCIFNEHCDPLDLYTKGKRHCLVEKNGDDPVRIVRIY